MAEEEASSAARACLPSFRRQAARRASGAGALGSALTACVYRESADSYSSSTKAASARARGEDAIEESRGGGERGTEEIHRTKFNKIVHI